MAAGGPSDDQLQRLAQLTVQGDFGQVRQLATRQLVASTDGSGRTILMVVADAPQTPVEAEKCVLYLFELDADPGARDGAGDTAAHVAARRNHLRLLALLPFDAKWLQNERGATPLMEAARAGSWRTAKHLLHLLRQQRYNEYEERGNSKRDQLLGLQDSEGRTALDLARQGGHSELASDIEREMRLRLGDEYGFGFKCISGLTASEEAEREELQRLADAGDSAGLRRAATRGNCDLPDRWGRTALMHAARNIQCADGALWQHLLQLGDPTCAAVNAFSCLHHAAGTGNSAAVSQLLHAGASANTRGWIEFTPLMWAAWNAPPATAAAVGRALLAAGSDWSLQDDYGRTALDLASEKGKSELAELLRGYEGKKYFDAPTQPRTVRVDHIAELSSDDEPSTPPDKVVSVQLKSAARGSAAQGSAAAGNLTEQFYPVTDPQGFCLIINISKYKAGSDITFSLEERQGSERDVQRVTQLFKMLRFSVIVKTNLTAEEIDNCLHEVKTSKELVDHGSFVCFLMAHGSQDCIYASNGVPCDIRKLTEKFQADVCEKLSRKPKIFFIQACRGSRRDGVSAHGTRVATDSRHVPVLNSELSPARGDFLLCFANTENSVAYRDLDTGSFYVQTICDFIKRHFKHEHLVDIMTSVNFYIQNNPVRIGNQRFHMVPQIVTQLSKKVCLDPARAQRL